MLTRKKKGRERGATRATRREALRRQGCISKLLEPNICLWRRCFHSAKSARFLAEGEHGREHGTAVFHISHLHALATDVQPSCTVGDGAYVTVCPGRSTTDSRTRGTVSYPSTLPDGLCVQLPSWNCEYTLSFAFFYVVLCR